MRVAPSRFARVMLEADSRVQETSRLRAASFAHFSAGPSSEFYDRLTAQERRTARSRSWSAARTTRCGARGPSSKAWARPSSMSARPEPAQTVKCCNQLMVGMHIQAVCEALALGRAAGLNLDKLREVLLGGAAASWMLQNHAPLILAKDDRAGFRIDLQLKDLRLANELAFELGVVTHIVRHDLVAGLHKI